MCVYQKFTIHTSAFGGAVWGSPTLPYRPSAQLYSRPYAACIAVPAGSPLTRPLLTCRRREKALQLTAEIAAANQTLQAFKLKDLERQREADLAMEGEWVG